MAHKTVRLENCEQVLIETPLGPLVLCAVESSGTFHITPPMNSNFTIEQLDSSGLMIRMETQ